MKAHPQDDHILLSCFDSGLVVIYDLRNMSIIQEIVEHSIYSIEILCMNNSLDIDFSPDGQFLALSSQYGTLSLYSTVWHLQKNYKVKRV
jgi:WD40 repeat protein